MSLLILFLSILPSLIHAQPFNSPMIQIPVDAVPYTAYTQQIMTPVNTYTQQTMTPVNTVMMPTTYVQAPATATGVDMMTPPVQTSNEMLPDLTLDARPGVLDYDVTMQYFDPTNCAVQEGCARAGNRRLLRFNSNIINVGNADLVLGDPRLQANSAFFHWSACHQHYHRGDVLIAKLRNPQTGAVVGQGNKIGVCMEDSISYFSDSQNKIYNCYQQGIQKGWADIYTKDLDCQYIDITDIPPGTYELEMVVNANRRIRELNYDNNRAVVTVQI